MSLGITKKTEIEVISVYGTDETCVLRWFSYDAIRLEINLVPNSILGEVIKKLLPYTNLTFKRK